MLARLVPLAAVPALLMLPPALAPAAAPGHRLDPAGAGDYWTPSRTRAALASDSMRHLAAPATAVAGASSIKVLDAADPYDRTNGRILAVDPAFGPFSCSGTALATPSGSIVITAGHCVVEAGRWATHVAFVPAYDHRRRPFGTFAATALYAMAPWRTAANSDFDIGALRVGPGPGGTLATVVGAKGWASGRSRYSAFRAFGYPAAALAGEELRSCASRGLGSDSRINHEGGPPTVPMRCDMAGGSSGGAWLLESNGLIAGVTSYGYPAAPTASSRLTSAPRWTPSCARCRSRRSS